MNFAPEGCARGTLADIDLELEASHQPCFSLCLRSLRCLNLRCCCAHASNASRVPCCATALKLCCLKQPARALALRRMLAAVLSAGLHPRLPHDTLDSYHYQVCTAPAVRPLHQLRRPLPPPPGRAKLHLPSQLPGTTCHTEVAVQPASLSANWPGACPQRSTAPATLTKLAGQLTSL